MLGMLGDNKKMASAIVARMKPDPMLPGPDADKPPDSDEATMSAAAGILSAIETKDPRALADALRAFVQVMDDVPEESEGQE